jgi:hypothetical protein
MPARDAMGLKQFASAPTNHIGLVEMHQSLLSRLAANGHLLDVAMFNYSLN